MLLGLRPYPKREPKVEKVEEKKEPKTEWPELVGKTGEEAIAAIKADRPDLDQVVAMPEDSMMTKDYRLERVRIMVDKEGNVSKPPRCG